MTAVVARGDEALEAAVDALRRGFVVGVPTDTVYGLAVDPWNPEAVEMLFRLKERPAEVALPVLVGGAHQVGLVAAPFEEAARELAHRSWPGPLTLVVPRSATFTADLGGPDSARGTVGVRWPDDGTVAALCSRVGPMAVTSANVHGGPPATEAAAVAAAFDPSPSLALVLDGGTRHGLPSTVVECRGRSTRCLRQGALSIDEPAGRAPG